MTQYAKFCTHCGTGLSGRVRFCTQCGREVPEQAPVAPPVAAPAPIPVAPPVAPVPVPVAQAPAVPTSPPSAGGARSVPAWLLAIGAVALVAIAVLGTVLVVGDDAKDDDRSARGDSAVSKEDPDPIDDSGEETDEAFSAAQEPEPVTRTCWDGALVEQSETCSQPTGRAGLRWVYPSLGDGYDCREPFDAAKVFQRGCLIDVPGQGPVRFAFSEWPSVEDARRHYQAKFGGAGTPAPDGQLRWGPAFTRGSYQVSIVFRDYPFSVSIIAESNEQAAAGARGVRHRSPAEFR